MYHPDYKLHMQHEGKKERVLGCNQLARLVQYVRLMSNMECWLLVVGPTLSIKTKYQAGPPTQLLELPGMTRNGHGRAWCVGPL